MKILRVDLCNGSVGYLATNHIVAMTPSFEEDLASGMEADPYNHTEVFYVGSDEPFYVKEPLEQLQARWAELL